MLHFGPRDVPNCHEWWSVLNDTDFSGHNSEPLSDYYLKLSIWRLLQLTESSFVE